MANLLTIEAKKKIARESLYRQVIIVLFLLDILFSIALVFNLTTWLGFRTQRQLPSSHLTTAPAETILSSEEEQRSEWKIVQLSNLWAGASWSSLLSRIIQPKTTSIKIDQIVGLWQEKTRTSSLVVYGQASSRQALVAFVDGIRREKFFSKVDLPIESFLSTSKGRFTLNLEVKSND